MIMIIYQEELKARLLSDLALLSLPIDEVDLFMRPFSNTYYGRYFPVREDKGVVRPKVYIYPYKNTKGELLDYGRILDTAIHEMCHHLQYVSGSYVRVRGVMHDPNFWKLYNHYIERAKKYELIGDDKIEKTI